MKNKSILILGGRSDIGIAVAFRFAKEGYDIQLAGRNAKTLKSLCKDIEIRHDVVVTYHEFDILDTISHENFVKDLPYLPEIVINCVGVLGQQKSCEIDNKKVQLLINTNYVGPLSIFGIFANYFERRGSGTLIGISSVAGDRGRKSNYIYGSSKAGFSSFLSGLRNRLHSKNVKVLTVKPGYVRTKMTRELNLPYILTCEPSHVANKIFLSLSKKNNIIYIYSIWYYIMLIIKLIPERFFKKLHL